MLAPPGFVTKVPGDAEDVTNKSSEPDCHVSEVLAAVTEAKVWMVTYAESRSMSEPCSTATIPDKLPLFGKDNLAVIDLPSCISGLLKGIANGTEAYVVPETVSPTSGCWMITCPLSGVLACVVLVIVTVTVAIPASVQATVKMGAFVTLKFALLD